jgi:hypothetical protein
MGEIGLSDKQALLQTISDYKVNDFWTLRKDQAALEEALSEVGLDYAGAGSESIVVSDKNNPEVVTAFNYFHYSPEKAKQIFYTQRIMSILFPHNFPHLYKSSGSR